MARAAAPRLQSENQTLVLYFDRLLRAYGPQRWWPARTRLEVILGAILTQNTSWNNAARAIQKLRKARALKLDRLRRLDSRQLRELVRPAGFYRQKARTIRNFLRWLNDACQGSLTRMFSRPTENLRRALLEVPGIGEETADAILLYAGHQPLFLADAYTRRVLSRHGLIAVDSKYEQARAFLHTHLAPDAGLFNEFHALLVEVGKRHCWRNTPNCRGCPLEPFLPQNRGSGGVPRRRKRLPLAAPPAFSYPQRQPHVRPARESGQLP